MGECYMEPVIENNPEDVNATISQKPVINITSCPVATVSQRAAIGGSIESTAKELNMYVNGREQKIIGGKFLIFLPLETGSNDCDIVLTDEEGNTFREKRTIFCGSLPPVLRVEWLPDVTPENVLTFSGVVTNPNQIKEDITLTVNGRPIDVSPEGTWAQDFFLKEGTNEFELTAQDTSQRKTVIRRIIEHHANAPEISFEGLLPVVSTHNISFSGKMKYYLDNSMSIRIHDKRVPVKDAAFSYKASIRTDITEIPFVVELSGRPLLKFSRKVIFSSSAPVIEIDNELKKIAQMQYRISGNISDENDVDPVLTVNGREVLPKKGQWSASLMLEYGYNTILVEGKNNTGKKTVIKKKIFVEVPEPVIVVGEYPEVSDEVRIILTGEVQDEMNESVSLTINQEEVKLTPSHKFNVPLFLHEGINDITFVAETQDNRRAVKVIRIEYSKLYRLIEVAGYLPRTSSSLFKLRGTVQEDIADERVAALFADGKQVPIVDNKWEASINLKPGENYVKIQVQTESGKKVDIQKRVWYDKL